MERRNVVTLPGLRFGGRPRLQLVLSKPPAWTADALCAQTDPEAFFPDKGASAKDAQAMCGRCAVSDQCLAYALRNNEQFGVWGGLTAKQRRHVRRQQQGRAAA